jgi:deoxyribose-phosphate aldolase
LFCQANKDNFLEQEEKREYPYFCKKKKMQSFSKYTTSFADLKIRTQEIAEHEQLSINRLDVLRELIGLIDLTTLNGDDTTEKVTNLCKHAISFKNNDLGIPDVAAVCVYPVFAQTVHNEIKETSVKTACVAGAFPSGQSPLTVRIEEVKYAIEQGADEIDMVISRGKLIEGDEDFVWDEVSQIKEACGEIHLKVILETGELKTESLIRKACELSIFGGADFLKTSTGKIQPAATPEAFLIMLDTIKEFYGKTGRMIGIKAAGGISEPDDALLYYLLVKGVLGSKWLSAEYFRIGASRLADKLMDEIESVNG